MLKQKPPKYMINPISKFFALVAVGCGLVGCASKQWVSVITYTKPPLRTDLTYPPCYTEIKISHTDIGPPITPEGFFPSIRRDDYRLYVSGSNISFNDINHKYSVNKTLSGSIYIDYSKDIAIIDLVDEYKNKSGLKEHKKFEGNGTYELRYWLIDGKDPDPYKQGSQSR